jgi:hypothetical protein
MTKALAYYMSVKKFYSTCPMRTNFCSKLAMKDKIARGGRALGSGGELGSGGARARGRESARAHCYKTLFNSMNFFNLKLES